MKKGKRSKSETEKAPYGLSTKEWKAIQKAALKIEPETAIYESHHRYAFDPYCADKNLPDECKVLAREDFARAPGSAILVCFDDLPKWTRVALIKRLEKEKIENGH